MMAGVIDDFQEALNELMRAVNLPVSVLIVKIGGNQDENDTNNLMELSQQAFDKAERNFVKVLDYEHQYKKKMTSLDSKLKSSVSKFMKQKFQHDLIIDLP
jgi:Copine